MGTMRRSGRRGLAAAGLCLLLALAAGCGDDDGGEGATESPSATGSDDTTPAPSTTTEDAPAETQTPEGPERTVIPITVRGDSVEPRGKRVQVAVGEPLVFAIDSDAPGELHVHATPEAEFAFAAGRSRKELTLEQPGIVEVELHEPTEVTVVQLEVR